MFPRTIITYLASGNPTGVKTVEFSGRLIKGILIPRRDFKEGLARKELDFSGIYILFGSDENNENLAYIGQAIKLSQRLRTHYDDTLKDYWTVAVCFTYKDKSLTKSDINFLEKELINRAKSVNRYTLVNGTVGNAGSLPEHRMPDMYEFLSDLEILILNLGYPLLKEIVSVKEIQNENNLYFLTSRDSQAKCVYSEEGFLVLKGSIGNIGMIPYQQKQGHVLRNRKQLTESGVIRENQDTIEFLEDYLFKTPTSACNIVTGGNYNGWIEWKNKDGLSLKELKRGE